MRYAAVSPVDANQHSATGSTELNMYVRILAARIASEVWQLFVPPEAEGAGKAGCPMDPRPRVQQKAHALATTGSPETSGFPCAVGFNGLLRALPGDRALLPPSPQSARLRAPGLSASVGAPGPHGLAVRAHASRLLPHPRPPHPASTFVTIAKRPSSMRRDSEMKPLIWGESKTKYFCCDGWTAKIRLKWLEKLGFWRRG
jgi:hypothetical protein